MKKIFLTLAILFLASSCAKTQSGVSVGLITSWKDTASKTIDNSVPVRKMGQSCATNILGLVAFGDSSIETAKRDGYITNVSYVDTTYFNIFGLYQKGCTIVKGQ